MLFDPLLKKNRAEAEEQAWTKNAPAEYESRNKADMDALTGQVGSGFDWDTASKAYQQYRDRVTGEAQDAAANAQANAAALAGGYDSSYADSVAKQGQQQALAGIDNAVPQLRSQALTEYQNRQSGLLEALSGMANTEALDQSAYGSNLANYNNRLNFLQKQSAQARSENDNYWNNLWNGITQAGGVLLDAYDGYKGYTQQQWENQMAEKQYNNSYEKSLLDSAYDYYRKGETQVAGQLLSKMGMTTDVFSQMGSSEYTVTEQMKGLQQAISMANDGQPAAAKWIAQAYGLPEGLINYSLYSQTGSGGGTNKESIEPVVKLTGSQLLSYKKERDAVAQKGGDTSWYDAILAANGVPVESGSQATGTGGDSTYTVSGLMSPGAKLALSGSAAKYGGKQAVSVGKKNSDAKIAQNRNSSALLAAKARKGKGGSDEEIYNSLKGMGYSDDEIYYALNKLG